MENKLSDIALKFNYLRDGLIRSIKLEDQTLSMEIFIPHIAKMYNDNNTSFFISLFDVTEAYLVPWGKDDIKITDFNGFEKLQLHILSADLNPFGYVEVQTEANNPSKFIPEGGMIFIKTSNCQVYDEDFERIDIETLIKISRKYWQSLKNT